MKNRYDNYGNLFDEYEENSNTTIMKHVHEFLGSTMFAEECDDKHNHRFAGVTGEAIRYGNSHVHKLATNTDFVDHHHRIYAVTGPAIYVGKLFLNYKDFKNIYIFVYYTNIYTLLSNL